MIPNKSKARGDRNNNPGNLRKTGDKWLGLSVVQNDPAFFQFRSSVYGIRALSKVILNYYKVHGLNTIEKILVRYAPPFENNTFKYIQFVSNHVGVDSKTTINVPELLPKIVEAIIYYENGYHPYSYATILEGVNLAGIGA